MSNLTVSSAVDALMQATNQAEIKTAAGLGNVDNTSDANKPVSTAQQNALDLKAALTQVVRNDTAQTLTPAQQAQALANIGIILNPAQAMAASHIGPLASFQSNGTDLKRTYRIQHTFSKYTSQIRLLYTNFQIASTNVESGTGNTITVTAGFEYPSGTTYQVTFNGGSTSALIADGGYVWSDPINVDVAAGAVAYSRSCPTVTSGQKWTMTLAMRATTDSYSVNTDVSQSSGSAGSSLDNGAAYAPLAITGQALSLPPSILCIGDSITFGTGDTRSYGGYFCKAIVDSFPWLNLSRGGTSLASWAASVNLPRRWPLFVLPKYAMVELGINDLGAGNVAAMQTNATKLGTMLQNRGVKAYLCTITPLTTSSDGWQTASGQTVGAHEATRTAYNDWVRTTPAPFSGYFEIADLVEANSANVLTRNGGRFQVLNAAASSGTATSGTTTALNDTGKTWVASGFVGFSVTLTGGTGSGQTREITANTVTQITVGTAFSPAPDATTTYVLGDFPTSDGTHPNNTTVDILKTGINTAVFQ